MTQPTVEKVAIGKADWSQTSPEQLVKAHLSRPCNTARAYACAIATFCEYIRETTGWDASGADAIKHLIELGRGAAKREMDEYVQWLRNRYPCLNTVRSKAQSIMGIVKRAAEYDVIPWAIKLTHPLPAPEPIRDTRGPDRPHLEAMLKACAERGDAKGARDGALMTLMAFGAYRCNEVLTLDLKHVNIPAREVEILAKGLWGRIRYPIPLAAAEAIDKWLAFRGMADGPLFTRQLPCLADVDDLAVKQPVRLTYWGVYDIVASLGRKVGCKCSPHKLRHFAATELMAQTDGRIPWAMALTRHRDPKTLMIYNDERLTRAREAMELVASGVAHYRMKDRRATDNP
jgi:integrase/recombinase XerC